MQLQALATWMLNLPALLPWVTTKQNFKSEVDGKRFYANLQAGFPMQVILRYAVPYLGASVNRVKIDGLDEQENTGVAMSFDEQKYTTTYGKSASKPIDF